MTDNIIISFRPSLFLFVSFRRGWSRAICKKEKKKNLALRVCDFSMAAKRQQWPCLSFFFFL